MTGGNSHCGNWLLVEATAADVEALMQWFPGQDDVVTWGGAAFRYPFTRESFFEDIHWGKMASFRLSTGEDFAGFGQLYELDGRIHLARLIVRPDMRGRGVGTRLVEKLIEAGSELFAGDECSLFVLRENTAACECYKSLGFEVGEYPSNTPYADICHFLTRPLKLEEN